MNDRSHTLFVSFTSLLLALVCLLGCEEDLAGRDRFEYPFAIYGVLSPDLDVQSILVFPVEDFPITSHPEPLDAVVTSTDLNTGEVRIWMDSLSADADGRAEHVFWSDFQADYGHTYRIQVARSDGARSVAEARVPERATVTLRDLGTPTVYVDVGGEDIRALKPEVHYVTRVYVQKDDYLGDVALLTLSYQGVERETEYGWEVRIRMHFDRQAWQDLYSTKPVECQGIEPGPAFMAMSISLLIGDVAWDPPGGFFNPDEMNFPGVMDNVENGFGFVGGGYRIEERLRPSRETIERSCFYYVPEIIRP